MPTYLVFISKLGISEKQKIPIHAAIASHGNKVETTFLFDFMARDL